MKPTHPTFDQDSQHVAGSQLNIAGDVHGPIYIGGSQPPAAPPPPLWTSADDAGILPDRGPWPQPNVMEMTPDGRFVGREDELCELHRRLASDAMAAIGQVAGLTGYGGIGKTALAVEYTARFSRRFTGGLFWINAENVGDVPRQIIDCGRAMELPLDGLSFEEQVERVLRAWTEPVVRLVILDNLEQPEAARRWCRPGGTRMLITSHCQKWPGELGVKPYLLDTLPRERAVELLCSGRPGALEDPIQRATAGRICEELGDFPLAVAMAAAYLEAYQHDLTLAEYEAELRTQPALENEALKQDGETETRHVRAVGKTFGLSYQKLDPHDATDALALRLFGRMGHLAGESVGRELLGRVAGLGDDAGARKLLGRALSRLVSLGLVQEEEDGRARMHRLVAAYARTHPGMGETDEEAWRATAEAVDDWAYKENESGMPRRLAPEASLLLHLAAGADGRDSILAGRLFNELGFHMSASGDYAGARECYARSLAIWEATLEPDDPHVATLLNNLGTVAEAQGDYAGSRIYLARAMAIQEKVLGAMHPDVALSLNNLGMVAQAQGDYAGAHEYLARARMIWEKALGAEHPDVARALNNLGTAARVQGNHVGAHAYHVRALAIREKALGGEHPDIAASLNNLGTVAHAQGNDANAREYLTRALTIMEKALGAEHSNVATLLNNLGTVARAQGDYANARDYHTRALAIREKALGGGHPDVATSLNNLGTVAEALGDYAGARRYLTRALAIMEQALGTEHPDTRRVRTNLQMVRKR